MKSASKSLREQLRLKQKLKKEKLQERRERMEKMMLQLLIRLRATSQHLIQASSFRKAQTSQRGRPKKSLCLTLTLMKFLHSSELNLKYVCQMTIYH